MMNSTLHILNGESTLQVFNETSLKGHVLVWNEVLAQGPVAAQNLWKIRADYICNTYGETIESYQHKVLHEIKKLDNLATHQVAYLWFEFDWVCQINLCYILGHLQKVNTKLPNIYLICPNSVDDVANFRGLGQLTAAQLESLLDSKILLQPQDFELASKVWTAYASHNTQALMALVHADFGNLQLLQTALQAYLNDIATPHASLNNVQHFLKAQLAQGKSTAETIQLFWQQYPIFGYTDLYLKQMINELSE